MSDEHGGLVPSGAWQDPADVSRMDSHFSSYDPTAQAIRIATDLPGALGRARSRYVRRIGLGLLGGAVLVGIALVVLALVL